MAGEAAQGAKVELVIDVPALLAPIPGDKPTGANPRDDDSATSPYYDVRNVRGVANAAEKDWLNLELSADPRADEARERAMQAWGQVQEKCEAILREKSKDLEIIEWLIEALVRLEDFAGLHAGLVLAAETLEKYWEDVNYSVDPDDPTAKGFNFDRLNKTLVAPIRRTPVTPPAGDKGPLPLDELQRMQKDKAGLGEAEAAARAGGRPYYQPLGVHIRGTIANWQRINKFLDGKMNDDAPMLGPLSELLVDLEKMVKLVAGSLVDPPPTGGPAAAEGDAAAAADGAPGGAQANFARPGTFATREQALDMLAAVAKYFREYEPQSPVSYALDATIDRARMSLPDLLAELLPDADARRKMLQIAGIRPPEPPPAADAKAKK
ncbi:MAG: type VI secretion system protein TssA [Alphaproteobacteria bacterium]|nr:type VI secretion system protein TssA [Alphaproteobacteria bacterium]MCW5742431.1 type VI secretion system protein TssA [Alphaproteobacteria bacterium]